MTDKEFVDFVNSLANSTESDPKRWENATVASYLRAMAAWVEDREGFYRANHIDPSDVPWRLFADMLEAGAVYE
jgi:hypothetical protein